MDQRNLFKNLVLFKNLRLMKDLDEKQQKVKIKKRNTFRSVNALYERGELILNAFNSGIFPIKETQGKGLKILTPKEML